MRNKRFIMIVMITLMVVGFATVSATLIIKGNTSVATKSEDFDVYFSDAYIDGFQVLDVISEDKKTITYETNKLSIKGENSVLDYEVTNASTQYDAKVKMNCIPTEDEWISVEAIQENEVIESRNKEAGKIKVTLKNTALEEKRIAFKCTLNMSAVDRESIKENEISPVEIQGKIWEFSFTGSEQTLPIKTTGTYKLEVWGAQGGNSPNISGGYGAYATGNIVLTKETPLYIYVGGAGYGDGTHTYQAGGFNGGGDAIPDGDSNTIQASGGGATHISVRKNLLKDLESYKEDVLIVASGGAGSGSNAVVGGVSAGSGGGIKGNDGAKYIEGSQYSQGLGGTQSKGGGTICPFCSSNQYNLSGSFGQGASTVYGGAGGGYYGGGAASLSSGGGSSYIDNPLLTEKSMACFECATSDEESTKTISVNAVSEEALPNTAKSGNGYAKITYLGK